MDLLSLPKFLKIAHRGYSALFPENTLCAFEEAIKAGAKMIELDVQLSKDLKPFVLHDSTLDRTTNGKGRAENYTLAELQETLAGYPAKFGNQFAMLTIPSLKQVLEKVGKLVCINIEIKPEAHEEGIIKEDCIEFQVIHLIEEFGLQNSTLISSFEPKSLLRIAKKQPSLHLGFLTETALEETQIKLIQEIKPFCFNPDQSILQKDEIAIAKEMGLQVYPYTVTTAKELQNLINLGVDGVFLNDLTLESAL